MSEAKHQRRLTQALAELEQIADPFKRLDATRAAREAVEQLEVRAVADCRLSGITWAVIGRLYGLTKQGAQQRFGATASTAPMNRTHLS